MAKNGGRGAELDLGLKEGGCTGSHFDEKQKEQLYRKMDTCCIYHI